MVEDAMKTELFTTNLLVTDIPKILFYAVHPC